MGLLARILGLRSTRDRGMLEGDGGQNDADEKTPHPRRPPPTPTTRQPSRPESTPTTRPLGDPGGTAGTQGHGAPHGTPSTQRLHNPTHLGR
ncbi:MAG: hypothetical protein QOE65_528 [Solirubrobacteraceae bacterium]|nr:hypothetical protein [Solirubrobacteraceae bacterium]